MRFIPKDQVGVSRFECAMTGRTQHQEPGGFFVADRDLKLLGTDNVPRVMDVRAAVCEAAVTEMAQMRGWASPEEIAKVREAFDAQSAELEAIRSQLDKIGQIEQLEAELKVAA